MANKQLSPLLPHYCMFCGAPLTYNEMTTIAGEGRATWKCSGCGREDTDNWTEFTFSADEQSDQSQPDIELAPPFPDLLLPMPPPPPPLFPGFMPDTPPPLSFDNLEDARIAVERMEKEIQEHQRQYEVLGRQIESDGVVAIIRAAQFPLFALNDLHGRFPVKSYGWGGGFWSRSITTVAVSSFSLTYAGPDYPNVTERIIVELADKDHCPELRLSADEAQTFDWDRVVRLIASLPGPDEPSMHALWEGRAIYQYVNLESARQAAAVSVSIQLQSGEFASWTIRRFDAPLPLAYAHAQIENTILDVGAIGPAAEEIESLLGQLTRLTPESAALDQINRGLKAWDEYFRR